MISIKEIIETCKKVEHLNGKKPTVYMSYTTFYKFYHSEPDMALTKLFIGNYEIVQDNDIPADKIYITVGKIERGKLVK